MLKEISEREFLSLVGEPILYIGIYELNWIMDDNLLDCEGVIIAFKNRKILISSKTIGEEEFDFIYYDFSQEYESRKIISSPQEPIRFVAKQEKHQRILRFQIGIRHIIVVAYYDKWIDVALTHWDINDEFVDFENDNLLNDYTLNFERTI